MENFLGTMAMILTIVIGVILLIRLFDIKSEKLALITGNKADYTGQKSTVYEIINVATEALLFRVVIYIVSYLMLRLVYLDEGQTFLQWWTKWDATNYIGIASGGYLEITVNGILNLGDNVPQTLVFFPMYPLLVYLLDLVLDDVYMSAIVVSTLCFVIACVFLYMAISLKYGKRIAHNAIILLSVFPFSFFYGGMLPESTFLMFMAMCMYFSIKRKWFFAGIAGLFCGLARLQGVVVMGFIGLEWMEARDIIGKIKRAEWKQLFSSSKVLPLVLIPVLGPVIYMGINYYYTGDFLYFMKLQQNVWGHSFSDIYHSIYNTTESLINEYTSDPRLILSVWGPQLVVFFGTLIVLLCSFKRHSHSMNWLLFVYLIISYSTDHMVSGGRYMSTAVPLFIMLGELCERRKALYKWFVLIGFSLFVIYMGCHTSGWNMVT